MKKIRLAVLMMLSFAAISSSAIAAEDKDKNNLESKGYTDVKITADVDTRCGNVKRYWTATSPEGKAAEGCI